MTFLETLPKRLRAKRKACNLTLKQVYEQTDLSISFLSDIETGRAHPSLPNLIKLAECYQTSLPQLWEEAESEEYARKVRIRALQRALETIQDELHQLGVPMENEWHPDFLPPPSASIQEAIEASGIPLREVPSRFGVTDDEFMRLIRDDLPITDLLATKIARTLGGTPAFWLNLDRQYRDWKTSREQGAR